MAFQKINKGEFKHSGRNRMTNTVRMSPVSKSSNSVFITVSRDVHELMGSPSRVHFLVGSGEDSGLVQIAPALDHDETAYKLSKINQKSQAVKATVSVKALGCAAPEKGVKVGFNIDSKGITIGLPKPRQHLNQMGVNSAWGLQAAE